MQNASLSTFDVTDISQFIGFTDSYIATAGFMRLLGLQEVA